MGGGRRWVADLADGFDFSSQNGLSGAPFFAHLRRAGMGMLAQPKRPRTGVESVDSRLLKKPRACPQRSRRDGASERLNVEWRSKAKARPPAKPNPQSFLVPPTKGGY